MLEDLGNIFTGSAMKTFGTFNCKNIDSKINKKNLGLTKTVNLPDKNIENLREVISWITLRNRSIMIDDEKDYKKVMDEKYKID